MDDPSELAKSVITGAVSDTAAKVLESTVALNLLNPAAFEVGQLMGEIANAARFYATDNMARIFKRWAENRSGRPVKEAEFRRVLPLLPTASLVSDEGLQERWARLLEATSKEGGDVLPSFGQTLAQLTSAEARYLEHLWYLKRGPKSKRFLRFHYGDGMKGKQLPKISGLDWDRTTPESQEFEVTFSDIVRLGIIGIDLDGKYSELTRETTYSEDPIRTAMYKLTNEQYMFSAYGSRFMRVMTNGEDLPSEFYEQDSPIRRN